MKLNIVIGSEYWKAIRRRIITATDAAPIMGVSKYKNSTRLFEEKMSGIETPMNIAMKRGVDLEPRAREEFENMMQVKVTPEFHMSDDHPFAGASFDGINGNVLVEIKCPGKKVHEEAINGFIQDHYKAQMQHQLMVADLNQMFYFSYYPEHVQPVVLHVVKRDDRFIEEMLQEEKEFYDCLMTGVYPDKRYAKDGFRKWAAAVEKYQKEFDEIETKLKEAKKNLEAECEGYDAEGSNVRVTFYERKGSVAYENIPELKSIDLDLYRKPPVKVCRISVLGLEGDVF